ncbi:unnamed protein product [Brassica oleracea var. botrytis]
MGEKFRVLAFLNTSYENHYRGRSSRSAHRTYHKAH